MKKIYSNIEKGRLLHIILRKEDVQSERMNIVDPTEFIQLAAMRFPNPKTFRAHKHLPCHKTSTATQESWVIIEGSAKAIFYDLDDTIITEEVLNKGDCSVTLYGGHTYEILEENTLVYEYKTGPYESQELDKEFIKS